MLKFLKILFSNIIIILTCVGHANAQTIVDTTPFPNSMINVNTSYSASGDGYVAIPYGDRFYYINHHKLSNEQTFGCIDKTVSTNPPYCVDTGITWPQRLPDGDSGSSRTSSTNIVSEGYILKNDKFYYPVTRFDSGGATPEGWGMGCYDLISNAECGYANLHTNSISQPQNFRVAISGPLEVNGKAYLLDANMMLHCVDIATMTGCGSLDVSSDLPKFTTFNNVYALSVSGEVVPGSNKFIFTIRYPLGGGVATIPASINDRRAICIDTTSGMAKCWGGAAIFPGNPGSGHNFSNFLAFDTVGNPVSICGMYSGGDLSCLSVANGADSTSTHSAFSSAMPNNLAYGLGGEVRLGTQTYFPAYFQRQIYCFDWSIQGSCDPAYPIFSPFANPADYALSKDDANCIWAFSNNEAV